MKSTVLYILPALLLSAGVAHPNIAQAQTSTALPAAGAGAGEQYTPEMEYDRYMRLGYAAEQRGDYQTAAQYFRSALYAIPRDQEATIAYWNAQNAFQESRSSEDQTPQFDRYMNLGYDATEQGSYADALAHFQQALELRPGDYYATQALRNVQTYLSRGEAADTPDDVPATYFIYASELPYDRYMRLGYAASQREDHTTAVTYFRSALYERPNDRTATIAYWNAVDAAAGQAVEISAAERYDRYMELGYDATQRGDLSAALTFFENALAERPDDGYAIQAIRNVETYLSRGD